MLGLRFLLNKEPRKELSWERKKKERKKEKRSFRLSFLRSQRETSARSSVRSRSPSLHVRLLLPTVLGSPSLSLPPGSVALSLSLFSLSKPVRLRAREGKEVERDSSSKGKRLLRY